MDIKTYKIEQYKDGSWVGAASTYTPNEYTGLTEDQTCLLYTSPSPRD